MTIDAGLIDVMLLGVNARNALALTGRVRQQRVAAQAEIATSVNRQEFRILRMVERWPMTIFAGDDAVQVLFAEIYLFTVAFRTVFMHLLFACVTILEWLILPDFLIGHVVKAVHEAVLARTEIVRNVKRPEQQNCGDNANDHK